MAEADVAVDEGKYKSISHLSPRALIKVSQELLAVTKVKPKGKIEKLTKDVVTKAVGLPPDEWENISSDAQFYVNHCIIAANNEIAPDSYLRLEAGDDAGGTEESKVTLTEEHGGGNSKSAGKSAKTAKSKKAAPVKETKVATKPTKKAAAVSKGRKSKYAPTDKIKLLVKDNPHRAGTGRFKRWSKYKNGMTVQAALDAGLELVNIHYSELDGHISVGK